MMDTFPHQLHELQGAPTFSPSIALLELSVSLDVLEEDLESQNTCVIQMIEYFFASARIFPNRTSTEHISRTRNR